jgi:xanthine dehydrogenase accessory factor
MQAMEDQAVVRTALNWLETGHSVALITVLRTWGSSPRPPGSLLAIDKTGHCAGSVSGGCADQQLAEQFRDGSLATRFPCRIVYGVDPAEAGRMGLPCGGGLELLVERLDTPDSFRLLAGLLAENKRVRRRVNLETGAVSLDSEPQGIEFQISGTEVCKTFGPGWRLILIGDGQIARYLTGMAVPLGYRVTICDPRPDAYAEPLQTEGVDLSRLMPDDEIVRSTDARSAIVTLAHDPRLDDLGLLAALESPAFYIGALGSTRTAEGRRQRLQTLGVEPRSITRIHAPAGLPIGSKRPSEIALSILAQITAVRNLKGVTHP